MAVAVIADMQLFEGMYLSFCLVNYQPLGVELYFIWC